MNRVAISAELFQLFSCCRRGSYFCGYSSAELCPLRNHRAKPANRPIALHLEEPSFQASSSFWSQGISSLNLSSESLDLPSRSPLNKTLHWRLSTQASPSGESHIRNCLPPHNKCFLTSANVLPYTARYFIRLFVVVGNVNKKTLEKM